MAKPFTDPSSIDFAKTLTTKLIPTVDRLRDLFTRFGLRAYKVRMVRVRWTGNRRGTGAAIVTSSMDILPTPKVINFDTMTEIVNPVGLDEIGSIGVIQISGRYTEEELRFLGKKGETLEPNEEAFYEIEEIRVDGLPGERRKFNLRGAPFYQPGKFEWVVRLERAHNDRTRGGDPA